MLWKDDVRIPIFHTWKDKVQIPVFIRTRWEFQCLKLKEANSNVSKDKEQILTFERIKY